MNAVVKERGIFGKNRIFAAVFANYVYSIAI